MSKRDKIETSVILKEDDIKELVIILNKTQKKLNKTKDKLNHLRLKKNFLFWGGILIYLILFFLIADYSWLFINFGDVFIFVISAVVIIAQIFFWTFLIQPLDKSCELYIKKIKIIESEIDKIENKILKEKCKDSVFQEKEIERITKKIRSLNIILFVFAPSGLLGMALIIWSVILESTNDFVRWTIIILGNVLCFYQLYLNSWFVYRKKQYQEYRKKIHKFNSNEDLNNISDTLILRSFEDDWISIQWRVGSYRSAALIHDTTLEELLNDIFKRYGTVQICAAPYLTLPYAGAERIYLGENWRDIIKSKAKDSQLIVIIPPISIPKGLEWELSMLIEENLLSKILVIFPPDNIKNLESRWLSFQDAVYKYSNIRFNGTVKYKRVPICCTFSEEQDNNINLKVKYSSILASLSGRIKYEYESALPSVIKKMIFY